jgi:hypothetical protein
MPTRLRPAVNGEVGMVEAAAVVIAGEAPGAGMAVSMAGAAGGDG